MNITLSPQVTFKQLDKADKEAKEAVLLDRAGEVYYELDEVGARLWQLLAVNGDFDAAAAQILSEFKKEFGADGKDADGEDGEERLQRELFELLEDMAQADLVAWE